MYLLSGSKLQYRELFKNDQYSHILIKYVVEQEHEVIRNVVYKWKFSSIQAHTEYFIDVMLRSFVFSESLSHDFFNDIYNSQLVLPYNLSFGYTFESGKTKLKFKNGD